MRLGVDVTEPGALEEREKQKFEEARREADIQRQGGSTLQ
jgi:hypothetical protein